MTWIAIVLGTLANLSACFALGQLSASGVAPRASRGLRWAASAGAGAAAWGSFAMFARALGPAIGAVAFVTASGIAGALLAFAKPLAPAAALSIRERAARAIDARRGGGPAPSAGSLPEV